MKKKIMQLAQASERRYDLDWLRFIAIVILLLFHTGMLFNTWGWHVKNAETSDYFRYWMSPLHFCRMPLLLFISGAGTYMALGKRTPKQFANERFRRLFIPLVFGMFIVVPPQIYYEYINKYSNYLEFYKTVFEFKPYPGGSFSWHHLWFILYLFLFSLISIPLLKFLRSPTSEKFKSRVCSILCVPAVMLFLPSSLMLVTQILLRPYFPEETHNLIQDWAYFTFYFCFFIFGMICYSSNDLWTSIGANRKFFLGSTVIVLTPFYMIMLHFRSYIPLPWSSKTLETAFDVIAIYFSWISVITIISFGQHYLNKPHRWLTLINEGLYPFYILHQTAIIAIGYYICKLDWSITAKFCVVTFLTLVSCLSIYFIVIRPFNFMRLVFGMKPKRNTAHAQIAE
ncbi:MAG: acyltransferase family protein [Chryseolinea sp.]